LDSFLDEALDQTVEEKGAISTGTPSIDSPPEDPPSVDPTATPSPAPDSDAKPLDDEFNILME
jgi:hypothetical protein